jgi:hypothetical protein
VTDFSTLPPCADYSRLIGEPLIGTISQAHYYFALQTQEAFGSKALPESAVNPLVFEHLARFQPSNTVLIRQPGQRPTPYGTAFFAANLLTRRVYALTLEQPEDLLNVALDALLAGSLVAPRNLPLYFICTNGRRDVCCARYGSAFYEALSGLAGDAVWQCSHIGGHRFAATGLVFPAGAAYGMLDPQDAPALVQHTTDDILWLEKLRGRLEYAEPMQAAEYYLRHHLSHTAVAGIELVESSATNTSAGTMRWQGVFNAQGSAYHVSVRAGEALNVLASTGDTQFKLTHPYTLEAIWLQGQADLLA